MDDGNHPDQLSQRKLLLPVISEGYASTKFQGGPDKEDVIKVGLMADVAGNKTIKSAHFFSSQVNARVEEQALVEEITAKPVTTARTTSTPRPRTTTSTTTASWRRTTTTIEPPIVESYERIPDKIPQSIIEKYALRPQFAVPIARDPEESIYTTRRPPGNVRSL
jgi:hypothetical protein